MVSSSRVALSRSDKAPNPFRARAAKLRQGSVFAWSRYGNKIQTGAQWRQAPRELQRVLNPPFRRETAMGAGGLRWAAIVVLVNPVDVAVSKSFKTPVSTRFRTRRGSA